MAGSPPARATGTVVPSQSLISRYELMGRLGTGGMAEVYLARARGIEDFEKIVVLKRIRADKASEAKYVGMLRDEARVAAVLDHPNIVHTYDVGIDEQGIFITMEYLHGEDVKSILDRVAASGETVPIPLALQIVAGAAAGLHYAHERTDSEGNALRIVHRDVSPSNVIVTTHNGVKLIDFGIAKAGSRKEQTAVGVLKGKASYMSPEQVRGQPLDRRSDVFSLGVMLYELTTMERPFVADEQIAVMHQVCNEPHPDPRTKRKDFPAPLAAILDRALAKDPKQRYPTAFEMLEDIERVTRDFGLHVLPGALARYLEHVFGPKVEPWLEKAASKHPTQPGAPQTRPTWDLAPTGMRATEGDSATITSPERKSTTPIVTPAPPVVVAAVPAGGTQVTAPTGNSMLRGFLIGAGASLAVGGLVLAAVVSAGEPTADTVAPTRDASRVGEVTPAASAEIPGTAPPVPLARVDPATEPSLEPVPVDPGEPTFASETPTDPGVADDAAAGADVEPVDDVAAEAADEGAGDAASQAAARKRRDAAKAADLVEKAGNAIVTGDYARAVDLIHKSLKLKRSAVAYSKLTLAECNRGRAQAAANAYRKARSSDKPQLRSACAARGITL